MIKQLGEIREAFDGRLVGKETTKRLICEVLLLFPEEIIDYVTEKVWFVSSFDDAWAFAVHGNELAGKHLIFLSDELLEQSKEQKYWTVAHEIGHIVLKHKNAILQSQSASEIKIQEQEADQFASFYLQMPPP